ncbi:hypothetical protein NPX13_g1414 [Xylaria arbuscula]|uniref:ATPase AAA-type core domain-containing protein n=1 Tax=Xylaria arbuscula TaxID=114810 RepID=A0A9W8NLH9_9PEZI|nr:hypothetical protein NPX13_g1414 [Xylaria arbuscula]
MSDSSDEDLETDKDENDEKDANKDSCQMNHVQLLISKCPICSQTLDTKVVNHQVEFRDIDDNRFYTANWEGPFNLEEARNMKSNKLKATEYHVLEVLTVVKTSFQLDRSTAPRISRRLPQDIMGDPSIAVSIHSRKLIIRSQAFIGVLKSVVAYEFGKTLQPGILHISEPFSIIIHNLENLRSQVLRLEGCSGPVATSPPESSSIEVTRSHVEAVLGFVEQEVGERINDETLRHQKSPAMCTFSMLWFLFKPGDTVYVIANDKWDAYVVESVDMGDAVLSNTTDQLPDCSLKLWNLDFDGRYVTRCRITKQITSFPGEKSIISLNVIPSKIWDKEKGGELRSRLENEGAKWYKLLAGKQMHYNGEFFKGRVYIDPRGFYDLEGPPAFDKVDDIRDMEDLEQRDAGIVEGCRCDACINKRRLLQSGKSTDYIGNWVGYDSINTTTVKTLETDGRAEMALHRYLVCSRNLKAFIFKTRKWETLDVAFCHDTKPNKNPFQRLVMPEDRNLMIESLVYKFTDPRYASDGQQVWGVDFIKNKGEGQIFLLHGGPGVRKTFTAGKSYAFWLFSWRSTNVTYEFPECIAELAGRPLLALTCGDIGTNEVTMEKELGKWLKLARSWGAVMLLDEADVFLEKRGISDLKRNSLVSVFLREIEYYQGILFLTTNRVGQFDDAFISRIHVVIHYPDLGEDDRGKIWNQFFDKLEDEREGALKVDKAAKRYIADKVCKRKWNGREIRNAFQTAVALAEFQFLTRTHKEEGEIAVLEEKDFRQVCDMTTEFHDYLTGVYDGDDEFARAGRGKLRRPVDEPAE